MANNKISGALESATAWAPTQEIYQEYKAYATKLDRLVEADKVINQYFCRIGMACPVEVVKALSQQADTLREIELER